MNNYTIDNIAARIMLTLPSRFTRETSSQIYKFFAAVGQALKINSDMIDELFKQTNLVSASGEYVDQYITELTGIGRKDGESDADYKERYDNIIFVYNSTKNGLKQIVIDLTGNEPYKMYNGMQEGAFYDSDYFYDDVAGMSVWGTSQTDPFVGYIEFAAYPTFLLETSFDEMCKLLASCKAHGITIYIKYPLDDDLVVDFSEGEHERTEDS